MRRFIQIVENAQTAIIYHTTSNGSAGQILAQCALNAGRNREGTPFISLSEKPLIGNVEIGDRADVSIGFHPYAFWGKIEPVVYTEQWYDANREKATYIAGEGWWHQWEPPEDAYDEEGFENEEVYGAAHRDAELDSFLDKSAEHEWVTREPYESLRFRPEDVVVLVIDNQAEVTEWQNILRSEGYEHVRVVVL